MKSSNPISNVVYISQYFHLDLRRDLVHNVHGIVIYIFYYKYSRNMLLMITYGESCV